METVQSQLQQQMQHDILPSNIWYEMIINRTIDTEMHCPSAMSRTITWKQCIISCALNLLLLSYTPHNGLMYRIHRRKIFESWIFHKMNTVSWYDIISSLSFSFVPNITITTNVQYQKPMMDGLLVIFKPCYMKWNEKWNEM